MLLVGSDLELCVRWLTRKQRRGLITEARAFGRGSRHALSLDPEERLAGGLKQRRQAVEGWSRGLSLQNWRGLLGI